MTNEELRNKLLEGGAYLFSFVILGDDITRNQFDIMAMIQEGKLIAFSVSSERLFDNFINHINKSKGINYIYNNNSNLDLFNYRGNLIPNNRNGSLWFYEDKSLIAQRQKKLGKLNYEIFRKRIIDSI